MKSQKKLTLKRETLLELKDKELKGALGGWECTVTEIGCTVSKLQGCGY